MTEFSRPIPVAEVDRHRKTHRLEATAAEVLALAPRLGVAAVHRLAAELIVAKRRGALTVTGSFQADIEQICVVTLDPFVTEISGELDEVYRELDESDDGAEVEIDLETPEPLDGEFLDLGELVAQYLALEIDPHPQAPGADLANLEAPAADTSDSTHPFSSLAKLRRKP